MESPGQLPGNIQGIQVIARWVESTSSRPANRYRYAWGTVLTACSQVRRRPYVSGQEQFAMGKAPGQLLVDLPQPPVVGSDRGPEQAAGQGAVAEQLAEHLLAGRSRLAPGRGLEQMAPQFGRGGPGAGKGEHGEKAGMVNDRPFARLDARKQDRQQLFLGQAVLLFAA